MDKPMPHPAALAATALAALALAACQPPPRATEQGASEPTKVEPEADAHEAAGGAVPRDESRPGETAPAAKGGY